MATLADVTAVTVFAAYLARYEQGAQQLWMNKVIKRVNSTDYLTIKNVAIGDTPGLSAYTPGAARAYVEPAKYEVPIIPTPFEDHFNVPSYALPADVTGLFESRAGKMADASLFAEQRTLMTHINSNPTTWTGEALFGTHQYPTQAVQKNKIVAGDLSQLNVVDPNNPTPVEAMLIMQGIGGWMSKYTNEFGRLATMDAKTFIFLCPTLEIFVAFQTAAVNELLAVGGTLVSNVLFALRKQGYEFEAVFQPDLVVSGGEFGANDILVMRTNSNDIPFVMGETPTKPDYLGQGSEFETIYHAVFFGIFKTMAFAPGRWESVLQATLS